MLPDPDSDEEGDMTAFYSPSGQTSSKSNLAGGGSKQCHTGQSEVSLSLSIGKGIGSFYTQLQVRLGFDKNLVITWPVSGG